VLWPFARRVGQTLLGRTVLVAGAYVIAAKLGLRFSEPDHIALLWPPAGLGVAAILLGGARLSPAIALGALLAEAMSPGTAGHLAKASMAAALIATFSTAESLWMARLLRSADVVGTPISVRKVSRLIGVAASGCTLAATGIAVTLWATGLRPWKELPSTWLSWSICHMVGVLVVAPPLLALFSPRRKDHGARGHLPLLSIGFGLSLVMFVIVRDLGEQRQRVRFEGEARDAVAAVQDAVDQSVRELEAIAALFQIMPKVNHRQFTTFIDPFLRQSLVIQAYGWIPRVRHQDRAAYESQEREWNPTFNFVERTQQGGLVRAADRAEYLPILFIEPLDGNSRVPGFDIASEPLFREALERMQHTNRPVATAPVHFDPEETSQTSFLIFAPTADGADLRGFALGAFRAADLIDGALVSAHPRGVALHVTDIAATDNSVIYASAAYARGSTSVRPYESLIKVAGRPWKIRCSSTISAPMLERAGAWLALITSLGFTAIIVGYFCQRSRAEAILRQAHDELTSANLHLAAKTTQLEATVRELMLARAQLIQEEKLKSVGRLAAGIAHEINTPIQFVSDSVYFVRSALADLTTLIGKYQAALRSLDGGAAYQQVISGISRAETDADLPYLRENLPLAVERSLDGLGRVATIVRSMKEFAHPDQAAMILIDLNHGIESTLTIARNEYKYVADVETDFDATLPMITCYAGELNQAVLNIIVNAAHAVADLVKDSGKRGTITVRTRRDGDWVLISIGDTGTGIPREVQDRIYDPFFSTKEVGRGTGQGLAIARSVVVDKHGGELRFETEEGKGTTFFIRLPLAAKA
jgi:signal transduction histidine kinase